MVSGLTALVGDPFAALSTSSNPSAMYKCLVCDKPVSIPAQLPPSTSSSLSSSLGSFDNTSTISSLNLDDQERSHLLHSPIKKSNLLSSSLSSLRQLPNNSSIGSPSNNDLPLPPVIASPGVSLLFSLILFSYFLLFYLIIFNNSFKYLIYSYYYLIFY